ncbi:chlorite dismutase family protein [Candidatus Parvarchaeota archaeon]|nr:chlorite dismutase family protein [Candidatus Parvarchaeota archaeon]
MVGRFKMEELFVSLHCFKLCLNDGEISRKELTERINELAKKTANEGMFISRQYFSIKRNVDLILFNIAGSFDILLSFKQNLIELFGNVLNETYSYLSIYEHPNASYMKEDSRLKYFVAYPVKKDPKWYLLEEKEQNRITKEHVNLAVSDSNNENIRSYTTYSFAIDDHEFLVMYEVESLVKWMKVARDLRKAEARNWIIVESPVFVGKKVENV